MTVLLIAREHHVRCFLRFKLYVLLSKSIRYNRMPFDNDNCTGSIDMLHIL